MPKMGFNGTIVIRCTPEQTETLQRMIDDQGVLAPKLGRELIAAACSFLDAGGDIRFPLKVQPSKPAPMQEAIDDRTRHDEFDPDRLRIVAEPQADYNKVDPTPDLFAQVALQEAKKQAGKPQPPTPQGLPKSPDAGAGRRGKKSPRKGGTK
jgi:hypothetical protein